MKDSSPGHVSKSPFKRLRASKQFSVVLVCFLIALVFWLLIALSHDYNATLTYPLAYTNLPDQKVVMNELPSTIALQVKTTGFNLLSYDFQKKRPPILVDVSSVLESNINLNRDVLAIPTVDFSRDFNRELGNQIDIVGYIPDSIVFYLSDRISKKLPVRVELDMSFEKQYEASGNMQVRPDSVTVSGPPSIINKIEFIRTEKIKLENVRTKVVVNAKLPGNKLLKYSEKSIAVTVPVEKFTEGTVDVFVHSIHVQPGYTLKTFPDKISIRYQVALSRYNQVDAADFDAIVDGQLILNQRSDKLPVQVITSPSFVKSLIVDPVKVDYILRKK